MRHGAKVKRCSGEGRTKHVVTGGVCVKHGAKVKLYMQCWRMYEPILGREGME